MKRIISILIVSLVMLFSCKDDETPVPVIFTQEVNAQIWVILNDGTVLKEYKTIENDEVYISDTFIIENPSNTGFLNYNISFDKKHVTFENIVEVTNSWIDPNTSKEFTIKSYGCTDYYYLNNACWWSSNSIEVTITYGPGLINKKVFTLKKS